MFDEPPDDDGYRRPEDLLDAGWISEDVVEEIRELLKLIEYPDPFPRPGSKSDAAMILIEHAINPPRVITDVSTGKTRPAEPEDPNITWAKFVLGKT